MAYLLAFGRWGSHLHLPGFPVYITDLLLVAAAVTVAKRSRWTLSRLRFFPALYPVLAITGYAVLRLLAGRTASLDAMRDAAPYLYSVVALLPAQSLSAESARRSFRVLRAALVIHLALVAVVLFFPGIVDHMPVVAPAGPDSEILALRADFDAAVLGLLALSAAAGALRGTGRRRVGEIALMLLSLSISLRLGSRSGLLALAAGAIVVFSIAGLPALRRMPPARRWAVALLAIALLAVAAPRVDAVRRLAKVPQAVGIGVDPSEKEADATGTAKARLESWRRTLSYVNSDGTRRLAGVGFGPDFLHDAGAADIFEGNVYSGVRAPHNYFINTYARLGLIGLVLVGFAFVWVLLCAVRLLRGGPWKDLEILAVLTFVMLLISATLGVILESPFGAIPAFWAAGFVLSRQRLQLRATPPR